MSSSMFQVPPVSPLDEKIKPFTFRQPDTRSRCSVGTGDLELFFEGLSNVLRMG